METLVSNHPILSTFALILEFWLLYLLLHGIGQKDTICSVEGDEDEFNNYLIES
jgi:hypothetical protein